MDVDIRCISRKNNLENDTLKLRPASIHDADLLLELRNDADARNASHQTAIVQREEHISWLTNSLNNPHRRLLIAEKNGVPVGIVRADFSNGVYELSWTVAPAARGRGVAKQMVALLTSKISEPIRAEIKANNRASVRIAEYSGMEFDREVCGVLHYTRAAMK